jgi:hypothetical protein
MKVLEAKVVDIRQEDPASEPDRLTDTWVIEAKLEERVLGWEEVRIDLQAAAVGAEIIETSMAGAREFTVRTRGKPQVEKGHVIHVAVRDTQKV